MASALNSWVLGQVTPSCMSAQAWRLRLSLSHHSAGETQGSGILHSAREPQEAARLFKSREHPVWNIVISGGLPSGQGRPGRQPLAPVTGESLPAARLAAALWLLAMSTCAQVPSLMGAVTGLGRQRASAGEALCMLGPWTVRGRK